jgi:hypothetical protein
MMLQRRASVYVVCVALSLSLVGCAGGTIDAPPEPNQTASSTEPQPSASTPSMSPSATQDAANPGTWIISDAGIGPVMLGSDVGSTSEAVAGAYTSDGTCEGLRLFKSAVSNPVTSLFTSDDGSGLVHDITVRGPELSAPLEDTPQTAEGITLGSTREDLLEAYPPLESSAAAPDEPLITTVGNSYLLFEITPASGRVRGISISQSPEIAGFCG